MTIQDEIDDIRSEIDRRRLTAETGEQWAEICALEARAVVLRIRITNDILRQVLEA